MNNQTNKQDEKPFNAFDEFWKVYPRKEGKGKASASWRKLTPDEQSIALNDCQKRYLGTDRQFIPHCSTYVNCKRWEDEIPDTDETEAYGKGGI